MALLAGQPQAAPATAAAMPNARFISLQARLMSRGPGPLARGVLP